MDQRHQLNWVKLDSFRYIQEKSRFKMYLLQSSVFLKFKGHTAWADINNSQKNTHNIVKMFFSIGSQKPYNILVLWEAVEWAFNRMFDSHIYINTTIVLFRVFLISPDRTARLNWISQRKRKGNCESWISQKRGERSRRPQFLCFLNNAQVFTSNQFSFWIEFIYCQFSSEGIYTCFWKLNFLPSAFFVWARMYKVLIGLAVSIDHGTVFSQEKSPKGGLY